MRQREEVQGNHLAIKPDAPKAIENGLVIPETARRHGAVTRGEIIAVGTGLPGHPLTDKFKEGDFVTFRTDSAIVDPVIMVGGESVWLVNILNVYTKEPC
jgi:co-chaperonin GroES (HSP10)